MNMVYVIYNTTMTEGDSYIALLLFIKINYRNDDNMTLLNLVKANTKCKYTSSFDCNVSSLDEYH